MSTLYALADEVVQTLLDSMPDRGAHLLQALDAAGFSAAYSHMHRAFQLIQDEALDADFRASAQELLQLLLTRKSYTKARESRAHCGDTRLGFLKYARRRGVQKTLRDVLHCESETEATGLTGSEPGPSAGGRRARASAATRSSSRRSRG